MHVFMQREESCREGEIEDAPRGGMNDARRMDGEGWSTLSSEREQERMCDNIKILWFGKKGVAKMRFADRNKET